MALVHADDSRLLRSTEIRDLFSPIVRNGNPLILRFSTSYFRTLGRPLALLFGLGQIVRPLCLVRVNSQWGSSYHLALPQAIVMVCLVSD